MVKSKDWSIDLNLDGYWDKSDKASYLDEKTELADGSDDNRYVSIFNDIDNTLYAARLILSRPVCGGELSFGGEYTYTNRRNINLNPEGIVSDDDSRIRENMGAAFVEYSRKFGSVQALAGLSMNIMLPIILRKISEWMNKARTSAICFLRFPLHFPSTV